MHMMLNSYPRIERSDSVASDSSDVSMYSDSVVTPTRWTSSGVKENVKKFSPIDRHSKRYTSPRMAPSPREELAKSAAVAADDKPAQLLEKNGLNEAAAIFRQEGIDSEFVIDELLGGTARQELKFLGLTPKQCIKAANILKRNAHMFSKPEEPEELVLPKSVASAAEEEEAALALGPSKSKKLLRSMSSFSRDPNYSRARGSVIAAGSSALSHAEVLNSLQEELDCDSDTDYSLDDSETTECGSLAPMAMTSVDFSKPPAVEAMRSGALTPRSGASTPRSAMSTPRSSTPATPGQMVQKRLIGFLSELSTEIQDGALGKKLFDGTVDRDRMNTSQSHWETLKSLFPLKRNTMSRLRSDAEKFTYNPKYTNDFGYPTNQSINSSEFSRLFENINLNNIGSPYNLEEMGCIRNTRNYEREVLDQIAVATGAHPEEVTGYITHGGTEAALYGLWNGRQRLEIASGGKLPVLYYSAECHYSCAKIANILGLEGEKVAFDEDRSMCMKALKDALARHPGQPAMIVATIGTTFLEAVDHVPAIKATLQDAGVPHWIHADAAYLGMVLPFLKNPSPRFADFCWSWKGGIDSISISGHKFCGTNVPCGIGMVRKPEDGKMAGMGVQEYANVNDNTISGCRNGNVVLELWLTFQRFWREGFEYLVAQSLTRAESAYKKLEAAGMNPWRFDKQSMSIVFDRPANQELCEYYHLMCRGDRCHIMAHNTCPEDMDMLLEAIEESKTGNWSPPEYVA